MDGSSHCAYSFGMDRLTANRTQQQTLLLPRADRVHSPLSKRYSHFPTVSKERIDEMAKNRSANDDLSLSRPTVVASYVFRLSTCLCSYKARYPRLTRPF